MTTQTPPTPRRTEADSRAPASVVAGALTQSAGGERKPLLAYIHVPFCNTKCTFCHWMSAVPVKQVIGGAGLQADYAVAVAEQAAHYGPVLAECGYEPSIVYWGGGTPTKLEPEEIRRVGDALSEGLDLGQVTEYTMESSPDTLTPEKLRALLALGGNRLSIGVQSFDDEELRKTARAHTAADVVRGYQLARDLGFDNINLDLLAALPGQSLATLESSLEQCIALSPDHVSVYLYNNDPRTVLARQIQQGKKPDVSLAQRGAAHRLTIEMLSDAGYYEYMPMYFVRSDDKRFAGEEYYFRLQGDAFGFGSGAHSLIAHHVLINGKGRLDRFLEDPLAFDHCNRIRADAPILYRQKVTQALISGELHFAAFENRFGFPLSDVWESDYFVGWRGFIEEIGGRLIETDDGITVDWGQSDERWRLFA
jgi:oxygen-independent coproporphyrinogen-3 oxidase